MNTVFSKTVQENGRFLGVYWVCWCPFENEWHHNVLMQIKWPYRLIGKACSREPHYTCWKCINEPMGPAYPLFGCLVDFVLRGVLLLLQTLNHATTVYQITIMRLWQQCMSTIHFLACSEVVLIGMLDTDYPVCLLMAQMQMEYHHSRSSFFQFVPFILGIYRSLAHDECNCIFMILTIF